MRNRLAAIRGIDWKVMLMSGADMLRDAWPDGVLYAAKIAAVVLAVCVLAQSSEMLPKQTGTKWVPVYTEFGEASWYGPGFHGLVTASGEIFNTNKMTAAHPSLPLGTRVEVTNLEKNKKVEVRITDRGPYAGGRVIDLSRAAAKKLGMTKAGTADVKIQVKAGKKTISNKKKSKKKSSKKRKVSKK